MIDEGGGTVPFAGGAAGRRRGAVGAAGGDCGGNSGNNNNSGSNNNNGGPARMTDQIKSMVRDLGRGLADTAHDDVVRNAEGPEIRIRPELFRGIRDVAENRRIAFVDGGNGALADSAGFWPSINRVYFCMFRGSERIKTRTEQRVEFVSCTTADADRRGGGRMGYRTRIYPAHPPSHAGRLPDERDMSGVIAEPSTMDHDRMYSMPRRFAEWRMATAVVKDELREGDMIVMDGSLQTAHQKEHAYARELQDAARGAGVTLCGLAKTSRLYTRSGEPLIPRVARMAGGVPHARWYVTAAKRMSRHEYGCVMVVRLSGASQRPYRLDILRSQFEEMDDEHVNSVVASLAANATDLSMPGYPYGSIDADRFAKVRKSERAAYAGRFLAETMRHPESEAICGRISALDTHEMLNGVAG